MNLKKHDKRKDHLAAHDLENFFFLPKMMDYKKNLKKFKKFKKLGIKQTCKFFLQTRRLYFYQCQHTSDGRKATLDHPLTKYHL